MFQIKIPLIIWTFMTVVQPQWLLKLLEKTNTGAGDKPGLVGKY